MVCLLLISTIRVVFNTFSQQLPEFTDRQTKRQTNADKNITSFSEVRNASERGSIGSHTCLCRYTSSTMCDRFCHVLQLMSFPSLYFALHIIRVQVNLGFIFPKSLNLGYWAGLLDAYCFFF